MTHWISFRENSTEVIYNAKPCKEFETFHWQNGFLSDFSHLSVFVLHYTLLCTQTWIYWSRTVKTASNKRWHNNGVFQCQSVAKKSMIPRIFYKSGGSRISLKRRTMNLFSVNFHIRTKNWCVCVGGGGLQPSTMALFYPPVYSTQLVKLWEIFKVIHIAHGCEVPSVWKGFHAWLKFHA